MPAFHKRLFFIRVFVPTGDPDGPHIVERPTGMVLLHFNRTNYKEPVNRGEFDKTGISCATNKCE